MTRIPIRPPSTNINDVFQINPIELNLRALDTSEDIIKYARKNNFFIKKSLDIKALIEENDELILSFDDIQEDGQILFDKKTNQYTITINRNHPPVRQRFTMAHEYIHYQMNKNVIERNTHTDTILYRDETTRLDIDIQANRYASEILMPEKEFIATVLQYSGNFIKIAEEFQVSTLAVRYRAKSLGIEGHGI